MAAPCPGEPAFCTFSISELRQQSSTKDRFLGAVQKASCSAQPSNIV